MRNAGLVTLIALLSLSAALTGCFGKNEEPGAEATPSTPTVTTPTSTTPTSPTKNGTTPPPPPPKPADINETKTLSIPNGIGVIPGDLPTGNPVAPVAEVVQTIANGGWVTFDIAITPTTFNTNSVTVSVLDPTGAEAGTTTITGDPVNGGGAGSISIAGGASSLAGDYVIRGTSDTAGGADLELAISIKY